MSTEFSTELLRVECVVSGFSTGQTENLVLPFRSSKIAVDCLFRKGGLVHQVSDWCSGAAANFGWMREAKREKTRGGL